MRYAKRMLLIPEDMYQSLMAAQQEKPATQPIGNNPLGHVTERMQHFANISGAVEPMNDDERLLHYQQKFKRYSKLLQEAQERPINVNVKNFSDASSAPVALTPQTSKSSPKRKRKRIAQRPSTSADTDQTSDANVSAFETALDDGDTSDGAELSMQRKASKKIADNATPLASTSMLHSSDRPRRHPLPTDIEKCREEVLEYVRKHPERLCIDAQGQLCRQRAGELRTIRDSNVQEMIKYHFMNTNEKHARKAPPGYATFIDIIKRDGFLAPRMMSDVKSGKGVEKNRPIKMHKKSNLITPLLTPHAAVCKKATIFQFKPQLW